MSPRTYLIVTTTIVVAALASYLHLVDSRILASREPPMNYPQYLLASSAGVKGKVIVESGSNSQHGIEPSILANYFKGPVIIVARNAGFPLLPKIYNLAQYVEKGDVVILPLEWNIYVDDEVLDSDFLDAVSRPDSSTNYYYQNLPMFEKARFLLRQFPLSNVIASTFASVNSQQAHNKTKDKLNHYRQLLDSKDKTAFGGIPDQVADSHQAKLACDGYILGNQLLNTGFTISSEFHRALSSVRHLVDRGATVYFTWPAVADDKFGACYQSKSLRPVIDSYADHIRIVVEDAGYQFVGAFRDSRFPSECFANTPYHLTEACAIERTRRLVEALSEAGAQPTNSDTSPQQLLEIGKEHLGRSHRAIVAKLEALLPSVNRVRPNGFNFELLLSEGWSQPQEWGVWSDGQQSAMSLRVASKLLTSGRLEINLRGKYFNGSESTGVTINGRDFGQHVLTDKSFTVASEVLEGDILRLHLDHHNAISPYQLGLSNDVRKMKYGLTEITLHGAED